MKGLRRLASRARSSPRISMGVAAVTALLVVILVITTRSGDTPGGRTGTDATGTTTELTPDSTSGDAPTSATPAPTGATTTGARAPGTSRSNPATTPAPAPVTLRPPVHCASTGSPTGRPLPSADERDGKRWVTVARLTANCDASSPGFHLLGIDTRLVWRSNADSFAAFVVDTARGIDATAGFADVQCAGPCSENQPIVPPAGDYSLTVQAGDAPWEIEIQEYRRP